MYCSRLKLNHNMTHCENKTFPRSKVGESIRVTCSSLDHIRWQEGTKDLKDEVHRIDSRMLLFLYIYYYHCRCWCCGHPTLGLPLHCRFWWSALRARVPPHGNRNCDRREEHANQEHEHWRTNYYCTVWSKTTGLTNDFPKMHESWCFLNNRTNWNDPKSENNRVFACVFLYISSVFTIFSTFCSHNLIKYLFLYIKHFNKKVFDWS